MLFALKIHDRDNVATIFAHDAKAGDTAQVTDGDGQVVCVRILQDIPYGHKVALEDIAAGMDVVKYGERIGRAVQSIPKGGYVHVHNVESTRARGDLEKGGEPV